MEGQGKGDDPIFNLNMHHSCRAAARLVHEPRRRASRGRRWRRSATGRRHRVRSVPTAAAARTPPCEQSAAAGGARGAGVLSRRDTAEEEGSHEQEPVGHHPNERAGARAFRARSPAAAWRAQRSRWWSSAAVQGGRRHEQSPSLEMVPSGTVGGRCGHVERRSLLGSRGRLRCDIARVTEPTHFF